MAVRPRVYTSAWTGIDLDHGNPLDPGPVTLGLRLQTAVDGNVVGLRFFRDLADGAEHVGLLLLPDLTILQVAHFHLVAAVGSGADQWHSAYLRRPHHLASGDKFVVAAYFGAGLYWSDTSLLAGSPVVNGNLTILQDGDDGLGNGLYSYGALQPPNTFSSSAYGVDVLFLEDS